MNTVIKILNKIKYISIQEDSMDKCDLLKVCKTGLTLKNQLMNLSNQSSKEEKRHAFMNMLRKMYLVE